MKFSELNLDPSLLEGIHDAGFEAAMPVQERTLSLALSGRDVCAQSQTGSGKTAAFLIPIFERMLKNPNERHTQALIIVPTRELAVQIEQEAAILGSHLGFRVATFFGGVGYVDQEKALKKGVDILIGTPGRLIDMDQSKRLSFKNMGILVIDEADRLFDMGFLPDLRKMLRRMPPFEHRQTMLFSATLNYKARELAWEYMNDPAEIEIAPDHVTVDNVEQEMFHVGLDEKMSLLLGLLKRDNPRNCLIFTNTKDAAVEVATRLGINGYTSRYIIGDLPQKKRIQIIEDMKSGELPILVATNVAARGIHIDDLELVINYDLPDDCEDYVHRIGRTARAGKTGKAISLACERYVFNLEAIEHYTHMKIPVEWADEELMAEDASAGQKIRRYSRSSRPGDAHSRGAHGSRPGGPRSGGPRSGGPRSGGPRSEGSRSSGSRSHGERKPRAAESRAGENPASERRTHKSANPRKKTMDKEPNAAGVQPKQNGTEAERLEYYRRKYGENFTRIS